MSSINFSKGTKLEITYKRNSKLGEKTLGEIIYIFKAYKVPSKKKVIKYYGKEVINPRFGRLFGPMKEDRFVIKKDGSDDAYIILPLGGLNRFFTLKELIPCKFCGKYKIKD